MSHVQAPGSRLQAPGSRLQAPIVFASGLPIFRPSSVGFSLFIPLISLLSLFALSGCGSTANGSGGSSSGSSQQGVLTISQTSYSFPGTPVGTVSGTVDTVTASNTGNASLSISNVTNSDNNDFPATTTCIGANLNPGNSCEVTIKFSPTVSGALSAQITFDSSVANLADSVSGNGSGVSQQQCSQDQSQLEAELTFANSSGVCGSPQNQSNCVAAENTLVTDFTNYYSCCQQGRPIQQNPPDQSEVALILFNIADGSETVAQEAACPAQ